MSTIPEKLQASKDGLDALLTYANGVTGQDDANIGDAVKTLCDGYGRDFGIDDMGGVLLCKGGSAFDTGFIITTDCKIELKWYYDKSDIGLKQRSPLRFYSHSVDGVISGAIGVYISGTGMLSYGSNWGNKSIFTDTGKKAAENVIYTAIYDLKNRSMYITDGNWEYTGEISVNESAGTAAPFPMTLLSMGVNYSGIGNAMTGGFYYAKVYEDNLMTHEYIPYTTYKTESFDIGLVDTVTKTIIGDTKRMSPVGYDFGPCFIQFKEE